MQERVGGCGLAILGAMGIVGLVAFGAWAYRAHGRTSVIAHTWPAATAGDAYAAIDHTAPWSEPWTKLCRIDAATHAERWCRSVPDGEHVVDVVADGDVVTVRLTTRAWIIAAADGANQ
jgi:hypothetical protein